MRRTVIVLALLLLAAAACGQEVAGPGSTPTGTGTDAPDGDGDGGDGPAPDPTEPGEGTTGETDTPDPDDGGSGDGVEAGEGRDEVQAYLVRSTEGELWVEAVRVRLDEPTVAVAQAAFEALVDGSAGAAAAPGLASQVPDGTRLLGVALDGDGLLTVDLSADVRDGAHAGSAGEVILAQQLAHTGAQFATVDAVLLHVEGEPVEELWGHLDWSEPLEPDPLALSPITFTSHHWREQVQVGDVTVAGEACTFEATVELNLVAPGGDVAEETFTTATIACPERGTWEHTFTLDQPGTWTVEAVEPDPSGGEGRPPLVTTLELVAG